MEACLRPANTIHYKSPLTNKFVFLDRIAKGKDGLEDLYHIVNVTASFLIPQPKVPRGTARASPCGDNGDGRNIAVNRVSLVRPVSADVPLLLWSLWRKKSIPEEMRLLLEMHMLFQPRDMLRPDDEIDALLLQDYAIFEKEMKERLDGCSQAIGEDVEGILAVNPAPLAKKLVDRRDISNYSAMLQMLDAARFQPDIDKMSKDTLQNFGDDLGDKANAFYIMPLEYPEDLVAASDRSIVGKYRKYRLFVLGFFGFNAAMAGLLLLCPTTLYFFGLVMVAWAPTQGCCNYRSGRWCFSLGAFAFVLIFGFAALFTTAGLLTSIVATRCGCALAADLEQPGIVAVVSSSRSTRMTTASHPSSCQPSPSTTLTTIVKRFSACYTEPRSAYRLLGEPYVRNASKAIGYEKQLSFLWDGFDQKELDQRLQFIGGSLGSVVNLSALSVLASKLTPLLQFQLEALKIKEIEKEVGDNSMLAEYADELKIALEVMEQHVPSQTPLNVLQDSLKKMEALMEVDSKPVDLFKSEAITDVGDTHKVQLAIDKATAQVKPYKDNIGQRGAALSRSAFWFCLASLLAVGIVAMFMALCMSTLYSRKPQPILLRRTPVPPPEEDGKLHGGRVSTLPSRGFCTKASIVSKRRGTTTVGRFK
ncbi:hypothetical protein MRX96_046935 [Rhipicephalus microplus]